MLDMMTATGKFLPPPSGIITGEFQEMGTIANLPYNDRSENSVMYKDTALFCVSGNVNGTSNSDIWQLDFDTRVASKFKWADSAGGVSNRKISVGNDGNDVFLYGGAVSGSVSAFRRVEDGTINGSWGAGLRSDNSGHGVWGDDVWTLGGANSPWCGKTTIPRVGATVTGSTVRLLNTYHTSGFVSVQANNFVYVYGRATGSFERVNIATGETATTLVSAGAQCHTHGVWDGGDNLYFITGGDLPTQRIGAIKKFTISTGTFTTIPVSGDFNKLPTAYPGLGLYAQWYKGAIYFWRCDMNTADGKKLWRIV